MRTCAFLALILSCSTALAQPAPTETPPAQPAPETQAAPPAAPAPAAAPAAPALAQPKPEMPNVAPQALQPPPPPEPIAGYSNGGFFLKDPHDWFVLFPRAACRSTGTTSSTAATSPPASTATAPKIRDPRTPCSCAAPASSCRAPSSATSTSHIAGEFASTPATGSYGTLADCYIIVDYLPYLKLQAGQFDAPFSLENRTSDKYFDFMERSSHRARVRRAPQQGQRRHAVGLAAQEGRLLLARRLQRRRPELQEPGQQPGASSAAPSSPRWRGCGGPTSTSGCRTSWVGGSFWWQRNVNLGGPRPRLDGRSAERLPTMTTQGGVAFFNASYNNGTDVNMNTIRSHLAPWGDTVKWGARGRRPDQEGRAALGIHPRLNDPAGTVQRHRAQHHARRRSSGRRRSTPGRRQARRLLDLPRALRLDPRRRELPRDARLRAAAARSRSSAGHRSRSGA